MRKLMMTAALAFAVATPAFAEGNTIGGAGFYSSGNGGLGGLWSVLTGTAKPLSLSFTWPATTAYQAPTVTTFAWQATTKKTYGSLKVRCDNATSCTQYVTHNAIDREPYQHTLKYSNSWGWENSTSTTQVRPN